MSTLRTAARVSARGLAMPPSPIRKLMPLANEAKKRGVMFDIGHGGGSFDYTVAEAAMAQGAPPDTISSVPRMPTAEESGTAT